MQKEHEPAKAAAALRNFMTHESAAGLLLLAAAAAALLASNTPVLASLYDDLLSTRFSVELGALHLGKPLLLWINDGLMAIFFFLVGLELKREMLEGHLSSRDQAMLPAFAAAGGMAAPALIYYLVVRNDPVLLGGWAIPAATDIAFALGAVGLVGSRVPASLKIFLLTLATLDDFGAIVIIALFYTSQLSMAASVLAALALLVLFALNRLGVERITPYVLLGVALWVFVLESGIHATLAGIALAMAVPLRTRKGEPIIARVEEALHPYVRFGIMPLFAFANAGLPMTGLSPASLLDHLPLAIALGLILGKPLGIMAAVGLAVGTRRAKLPRGATWLSMLGIASLAGIGFTMSLFIGTLAFGTDDHALSVRLGVLAGSLVSALVGLGILMLATGEGRLKSVSRP
jgi:Na+:H+ antiporter, NhaA family